MDKRLGFAMVLSASALAWVGCDGDRPADSGMCVPGPGVICLDGDGGADAGPDAGPVIPPDGGPVSDMCQSIGSAGGTCRTGARCGTGLRCFGELTMSGGMAFTLSSIFEIPTAVPDPENPGEFLTANDFEPGNPDTPTFAAVPVGFGPGGQCTEGCNPASGTDMCPSCSTCETGIGGAPAFAAVGITVRTFDNPDMPFTSTTNTGICRADCVFDPEDRGCQDGYSCQADSNVCLEECVSDAQCNLGWGQTRHEGLVAVVDGSATCNTTTGRCEWEPPAGAAFGSECESNADCPADIGFCAIGGRCLTLQCNLQNEAGAAVYPCAEGSVCVGIGGNEAAFCLDTCTSPADCFPGIGCVPIFSDGSSACWGICEMDSQCHADERCEKGGFQDPDAGTCQRFCDPAGANPDAITCAADERCVQVTGQTYGFCEPTDLLCTADSQCLEGQACEVLGNDFLGECVDGCTTAADCAAGEDCRIQEGGETCTPETAEDDCNSGVCVGTTCAPSTVGVCRAPGGECSASPRNAAMDIILPLRGNPQCLVGQTCSSTTADALGTCMGTITLPDAGMAGSDAGMADGGPDAGPTTP